MKSLNAPFRRANSDPSSSHLLCFRSLSDRGRGLAFSCDAQGQVNLDALSDRALNDYLFARTVIGREFLIPEVEPALG